MKQLKNKSIVIKKEETAPIMNTKRLKPDSRVSIPSIEDVINAKEWVEENQK